MKIVKYAKWQWNKFELWQKLFILAMLLQATGYTLGNPYGIYLIAGGISIVIFYITKWFLVDVAIQSWNKFRQEENNLFDTIKNSDKK